MRHSYDASARRADASYSATAHGVAYRVMPAYEYHQRFLARVLFAMRGAGARRRCHGWRARVASSATMVSRAQRSAIGARMMWQRIFLLALARRNQRVWRLCAFTVVHIARWPCLWRIRAALHLSCGDNNLLPYKHIRCSPSLILRS